jgi:hypothetical protein
MDCKPLIKSINAILGSILFLVLGFLILWIAKTKFNIQQDAILVSLILIPVLLYLILSGKLQEFSAGGVSAKFNDAAQKQIIKDENVEPLQIKTLMKGDMRFLEGYLAHLSSHTTEYTALAVILGHDYSHNYTNVGLLEYLEKMSRYPNFKFLIVFDQAEAVFAYVPVSRAIQILKAETAEENGRGPFTTAINEGRKTTLLHNYELIKPTVLSTDTNLKALEKMTEKKMDALIVTDKNRMLKGLVEREQLLSKLILAMTK